MSMNRASTTERESAAASADRSYCPCSDWQLQQLKRLRSSGETVAAATCQGSSVAGYSVAGSAGSDPMLRMHASCPPDQDSALGWEVSLHLSAVRLHQIKNIN